MKKQQWDEVFEPLVDAARKVGDNMAAQMRKQRNKVDDFLGKLDNVDHQPYDGMGHVPRDVYDPRPPGLTDAEYREILDRSVHNGDAPDAVLGKFRVEGTQSYVDAAEGWDPPATYFSLGTEWDDIKQKAGLTDAGMFEAFNVPFLDRIIEQGKDIHFSHDPNDFPNSALSDELEYLENAGFKFDPSTMTAIAP
jgi:hypothetical protein